MNQSFVRLLTQNIEQFMTPVARTLTRSVHLVALRDGFQLAMPFIFVGCMFVPLIFPPVTDSNSAIAVAFTSFADSLRPVLLPTYQLTMGVVGLIVSFGIASSLAKQYALPERLSGLTGCMAFLMLTGFYGQETLNIRYLGGSGLFSAILAGFYTVEIIRFFVKRGWCILLPEDVPILTYQSFKLMLPIMTVLLTLSLFNHMIATATGGALLPQLVEQAFQPLILASDSLAAVLISILICQLLWFLGIHGALIVTGIMYPFWMSNLLTNQQAMEAGQQVLPHIYLPAFWDFFILIGGVGSTLPLVFLAMRSRSNHLKSVGKIGVIPSLFNINEPILFGFPIIMNPLFIFPFILVPMINAVIAWYLTSAGILERVVVMIPWSVPAPIGAAWASNGSIANTLMVVLAMVNSYFLYLPFFRAHEKAMLEQEALRSNNRPDNRVR